MVHHFIFAHKIMQIPANFTKMYRHKDTTGTATAGHEFRIRVEAISRNSPGGLILEVIC